MFVIKVDWISQIPDYTAAMKTNVDEALMKGAQIIQTTAKELVHKDTGSLADTIDIDPFPDGLSINAGNTSGGYKGGSKENSKPAGAPIDYALEQEFGLGNVEGYPYMQPAAEQGFPQVLALVQATLEQA